MKRKVILIFLLLTTLIFAEETKENNDVKDEVLTLKSEIRKIKIENEELKELEKRFIILEATMNGIEKERVSSVDYHERALEDSKDNFDKSLSHIYWFVGIIITLVGIAIAILQMVLRNEAKKNLEKERDEIENFKNEIKLEIKEVGKKSQEFDKNIKLVQKSSEEMKINLRLAQVTAGKTTGGSYLVLKILEEEIKKKPEEVKENLYFYLACSCHRKKKFYEAIEYYTKVISINSKNKGAYTNRGTIYSCFFKNYEKAKQDHKQAILIDDDFKLAHYNLGNEYLSNDKNYKKAFEEYSKVINLGEDKFGEDFEVYQQRVHASLGLKDYIKALSDLESYLKKTGNQKFKMWITKDHLEGFTNWLIKEENKADLEKEVLRRLRAKEGITIAE